MPVLSHIECSISGSNGIPFQEYPAEPGDVTEIPTATVYVQARDGEPFVLNCTVKPSFDWNLHGCDAIDFKPSIDGVFGTGVLCTIDKPSKKLEGTLTGKYGSVGTWGFEKFMVSSVRFTEDKSEGQLSKMEVDNLGEIRLIVRRFVCKGSNYKLVDRDSGHEDSRRGKEVVVHEKAIKGRYITHAVKYGEATTVKTPKYLPGRKLETKERPFMIFRFLYRSE
ncbi:hypothetical protein RUND412_008951, partial [Rhizina undulata]